MNILRRILNADHRLLLLIIIITGIGLQLIALFTLMDPHRLNWLDPQQYYDVARDLANGKPYSTPDESINLLRAPGYPFFLAALIYIFGDNILIVRLMHILLYAVFIISVYHLGVMVKNKYVGIVAVLMCLVYPYYIYIPATLYSESLTILLFPLFLILTVRIRNNYAMKDIFFLGVLLGYLILCRPTNIYLVLASLVFILWRNKITFYRLLRLSVIGIIPVVLVFSWMLRNKRVHGEFIYSTGGMVVLIQSYNENTIPGVKMQAIIPENIDREVKVAQGHIAQAKVFDKHAKRFIRENPGRSLKIALFNVVNYWNPIPLTMDVEGEKLGRKKIIPALFYSVFILLGILGYIRNRKDLFANTVLLLLILNTALNAPFMVSIRYRVVLDFTFIILAAVFVTQILEKWLSLADETT